MTKATEKIKRAIELTERWIRQYEQKLGSEPPQRYTDYGLTIYGCELRNLEEYQEMLKVKDKRKLKGRLRELFNAI